ncbi:fluoride efflux transporter CrcB [Bacillus sp. FJAT-49736]|uniref:fluoride efflux transporter CrcB n=1 Tax=Bacillus sp. FJAT-49736 TaxID=2833582 RepID=UPI001BC9DA6F|nr:fluoride efflux transporter CrcB [Bacillus sp. FJAT-49736]MBS4171844.1 fluoride efflux transporter CrcB [Bacillus sp. FJAT-49736]
MVINSLLVAIGGFFGAIARFGISNLVKKHYHSSFPIATIFVNLLGAFLLGFMKGEGIGDIGTLLFGTGFMGAFTTFSTFKVENIELYDQKKWLVMVLYLGVSYTFGILFAFLGMVLGS